MASERSSVRRVFRRLQIGGNPSAFAVGMLQAIIRFGCSRSPARLRPSACAWAARVRNRARARAAMTAGGPPRLASAALWQPQRTTSPHRLPLASPPGTGTATPSQSKRLPATGTQGSHVGLWMQPAGVCERVHASVCVRLRASGAQGLRCAVCIVWCVTVGLWRGALRIGVAHVDRIDSQVNGASPSSPWHDPGQYGHQVQYAQPESPQNHPPRWRSYAENAPFALHAAALV